MRLISKLFDSDRRQITKSLNHSDSSESSTPSSSLTDATTGSNSLHSTLSLQTLPSVPSLQKIPSTTVTLSHSVTSSFKLRDQNLPITCLAVNKGHLFAVSGHEINIYDRNMSAHLHTFNGQDTFSGTVKSVSFSSEKIFTAHQDGTIGVWKLTAKKGYKRLTTLPTLNDRLRRFALPKNYVQIRRHRKRLWIEHSDAVTGITVNNGFIYSVSWDKTLKIWRVSDLRCKESIKAHDDAVNAVAVASNGTVYTGSADRRIRVWTKPTGTKRHSLVATLEKHKSAVNALALNEDGSVLFSGSCDRSILVWEREDTSNYMVVRGALRGHDKAILSLFNVSDLLISGSADRTVRIWRRGCDSGYSCLEVLKGHIKPVKSLAAVREKELNGVVSIVSGSLDGEVKCWKVSVTKPDYSLYTDLVL